MLWLPSDYICELIFLGFRDFHEIYTISVILLMSHPVSASFPLATIRSLIIHVRLVVELFSF